MDCPLWCVLSERRRHIEKLWRRRLLVTADERRARRRFLRLMRGFDAEDVQVLRRAVESEGRDARQCAPGPPMDEREEEHPGEDSGLIPQIDRPMSMPYLCCKLWRWRELQVDAALHTLDALPWCRFGRVTINNATVSCCNPFHYALWIRADVTQEERAPNVANGHVVTDIDGRVASSRPTPSDGAPPTPPPPPPEDEVPEDDEHIASHPSSPHTTPSSAWGELCRFERRDRVGGEVPLTGQFAAVGLLASSVHDAQAVSCDFDIRNDVSFALIRQPTNDVWLYNSGCRSLFVSVVASSKADALRRLSPGYCVRVFKAPSSPSRGFGVRPDSHAVISVGAGWGSGYDRPTAEDTRIRYEVSFRL